MHLRKQDRYEHPGSSWARPTFEQGCLSALPHLEGSCKALSLPGERLFQASRILPNRMRPAIFHAFGRAKADAQTLLDQLAHQGWETLPIAILGMPHYPAGWSSETWKPIGGCSFTGSVGLTGNSALRFCLLMQWHSLAFRPSMLFAEDPFQGNDDMVSVHTPSASGPELCARQLMQAATDQDSSESGSSTPEHRNGPGESTDRPSNPPNWTALSICALEHRRARATHSCDP